MKKSKEENNGENQMNKFGKDEQKNIKKIGLNEKQRQG